MNGKLFVIGTPIGNLGDISLRAIETLSKVEILVCEDSRVASKLINSLIAKQLLVNRPRYFAYNEFNEDRVWQEIVTWVAEGKLVGLVTDAGMPAISDPGFRLIRGVIDAKLPLEIIPGPTALTTALPWSGMGGEVVLYLGFLPKTSGKAQKMLEGARATMKLFKSTRLVLYVSPHRVEKDLSMLLTVMGNVRVVLMRELTKQFEERIEGTVVDILAKVKEHKPKGELVLVVSE